MASGVFDTHLEGSGLYRYDATRYDTMRYDTLRCDVHSKAPRPVFRGEIRRVYLETTIPRTH